MEKLNLTEIEEELIEAIRNFKNSRHNPSFEYEMYVRTLFEILLNNED
jgi:hypothetical protein